MASVQDAFDAVINDDWITKKDGMIRGCIECFGHKISKADDHVAYPLHEVYKTEGNNLNYIAGMSRCRFPEGS